VEYILNFLNAFSKTSPLQELGDALSRALGAVTTPLSRLVDNPSEALAIMDPGTVVVLGAASFIVILVIGYYTLLTA
jgi:hypothetical protein